MFRHLGGLSPFSHLLKKKTEYESFQVLENVSGISYFLMHHFSHSVKNGMACKEMDDMTNLKLEKRKVTEGRNTYARYAGVSR